MGLTPMMLQYFEIKERYKDCIVFFRLGDFYEMFFDDAKTASKELELVLTGRDCGLEERAPMCGIPFHASANYISRLVQKGYKVAICEQVQDPSEAKGIVKRDVIKVITPGTYIDPSNDECSNTYLMSITESDGEFGLAISDISTGEFKTTSFKESINTLEDEIAKISPKEIIVFNEISDYLNKSLESLSGILISKKDYKANDIKIESMFENYKETDISSLSNSKISAIKLLLSYIKDTQKCNLSNINFLDVYEIINFMTIDSSSRRNLELTENIHEKTKKGSLLWVLDNTSTTMGGRALRKWIEEPLISKDEIDDRLNGVDELYKNISLNEDIRASLKDIYDIERIVGKIANGSVNAKDLISLKNSLTKVPAIKNLISSTTSTILKKYYDNLDPLLELTSLLEKSIKDDPSISLKEGNIIKDTYSKDIDELRIAKTNGKEWIASLENSERDITGIKSLKVGYNKVFGYYIEIRKANYDSIPEGRYIRKQTLSNSERYITQELKEMEDKILGAEEKLINLEYKLFLEIRCIVEKHIPKLKNTARTLSNIDVLSTLAKVALENNYVKPTLNSDGIINIVDGRHPVVEKVIGLGEFISNDSLLNRNNDRLLLITGPNMAGKSTYMRQVALITLMAQIGSFVPAKAANISLCDKIFTRIGASDDLAGGKSTFMVEMWEVSNILNNATSKSLVLLDEVGRGTSTYDGLSIAWAVIEYISKNKDLQCNTLFATHYHELTKLEGQIEGVKNYSVAVKEMNDSIIFLRKIIEGGADQSYGIEVAKLAGLPEAVINRAKDILNNLENVDQNNLNTNKELFEKEIIDSPKSQTPDIQMDFESLEKENLLNEILNINILELTPMSAMNELYSLINKVKALK